MSLLFNLRYLHIQEYYLLFCPGSKGFQDSLCLISVDSITERDIVTCLIYEPFCAGKRVAMVEMIIDAWLHTHICIHTHTIFTDLCLLSDYRWTHVSARRKVVTGCKQELPISLAYNYSGIYPSKQQTLKSTTSLNVECICTYWSYFLHKLTNS